ncbi:DUF4913 domain-containing protein [Streptomyces sp. NPDC059875]|uniref:DUF4913 domain-containing protein n=1 Tax=unclassified Streptomyces TaxID=2593676 RepID=UPI0036632730
MAEGQDAPETDDEPELIFESLDKFVGEYLCVILRRRVDGEHLAWCADWWRHPEAVARLAALWRAFEYLSTDPALGLTSWWVHHADPHLATLLNPLWGPFALCTGTDGHSDALGELPNNPAPPEMWDHPAFSLSAADRPRDQT